ncbi:MAG: RraA family protein [Thermomicrobiales bacterium]|nr:MAG: RraA family protein [Thermomicrobiales bacterium]
MASFVAPDRAFSDEQLAFLKSVDSPTIANAIEPFELRDRTDGYIGGNIGCLYPDLGVMVGQALTIKVSNPAGPVAGRDGYWAMWDALEQMPKPAVIVMQDISGAPHRCAYAGEVMATLATKLGAVGMVSDGGYRDIAEVHALGMHYFCPFAVVAHGNFAIQDVGQPVWIDGQRVSTGDILHGDVNGIVIVPRETLDGLPAAVEEIRVRERRVMDYIKSDKFNLADFKVGKTY